MQRLPPRKRGTGSVFRPSGRKTWTIKWRERNQDRFETGFKTESGARKALDNRIRERDLDYKQMQEIDAKETVRREDAAYQEQCRKSDRAVEFLAGLQEDADFDEAIKQASEQRRSLRESKLKSLAGSAKGNSARSLAKKMLAVLGLSLLSSGRRGPDET